MLNEYEKIGGIVIECFQKQGRWYFKKNNTLYDLAPASITEYNLSPIVWGIDRLLGNGLQIKDLSRDKCLLVVSKQILPKSDVKLSFIEPLYDGWLYAVDEMNLKGLITGQKAWICPYIRFFFDDAPSILYVKIEELQNEN